LGPTHQAVVDIIDKQLQIQHLLLRLAEEIFQRLVDRFQVSEVTTSNQSKPSNVWV
jgi:hypothetical protein